MKETTKDKKAIVYFKKVAESCTNSWIELQDQEMSISETYYTCNVIIEDNECIIYKNFGGFNKYEVCRFNIKKIEMRQIK